MPKEKAIHACKPHELAVNKAEAEGGSPLRPPQGTLEKSCKRVDETSRDEICT